MAKSIFITAFLTLSVHAAFAQDRQNPVIADYGGIWDVPEATVKADENLNYKIVIDMNSGSESPEMINPALNNVARMLNLHAVAGADPESMQVILAIHASTTYAIMTNKGYRAKYGIDNPNLKLISQLHEAGVKLTVCGQSLIAREVAFNEVLEHVEVATSMLTTVTTLQNRGYGLLRF